MVKYGRNASLCQYLLCNLKKRLTVFGLQLTAKILEKEDKHYIWFDVKPENQDAKSVEEANKLNAKFTLWVFEISVSKASALQKKLEDVIKS